MKLSWWITWVLLILRMKSSFNVIIIWQFPLKMSSYQKASRDPDELIKWVLCVINKLSMAYLCSCQLWWCCCWWWWWSTIHKIMKESTSTQMTLNTFMSHMIAFNIIIILIVAVAIIIIIIVSVVSLSGWPQKNIFGKWHQVQIFLGFSFRIWWMFYGKILSLF